MARAFFINGESLVLVKGASDTGIASLSQLGLAADPVRITPVFRHRDINVDAWGESPADVQWMLAEVQVTMTLIHFDRSVLDVCLALSMGGGQTTVGQVARAGRLLGNNTPLLLPGNKYIVLQITSPVGGVPWQFNASYLTNPPMEFPLGVEKSMVPLNWRVIPYPGPSTSIPLGSDPGGVFSISDIRGATNNQLWQNTGLLTA